MEKEVVSGGSHKPTLQHKPGELAKRLLIFISRDEAFAVGTEGTQ